MLSLSQIVQGFQIHGAPAPRPMPNCTAPLERPAVPIASSCGREEPPRAWPGRDFSGSHSGQRIVVFNVGGVMRGARRNGETRAPLDTPRSRRRDRGRHFGPKTSDSPRFGRVVRAEICLRKWELGIILFVGRQAPYSVLQCRRAAPSDGNTIRRSVAVARCVA